MSTQKIYTKKGDGGISSLYNGDKLPKSHIYFETLDNINDTLGCYSLPITVAPAAKTRNFSVGKVFSGQKTVASAWQEWKKRVEHHWNAHESWKTMDNIHCHNGTLMSQND